MRLIDADKLIEVLNDMPYIKGRYDKVNADEKFIFGCETVYEIVINMLEEQPTAFDVDKVVKELEELKDSALKRREKLIELNSYNNIILKNIEYERGREYAFDDAIDIVKAGGIDERDI